MHKKEHKNYGKNLVGEKLANEKRNLVIVYLSNSQEILSFDEFQSKSDDFINRYNNLKNSY